MKPDKHASGFTVIEIVVLVLIAVFVLGIAVPKFISATNLRRAKELSLVLNRLFEAQYNYHHKHGTFITDIGKLPIRSSDINSRWFRYEIPYATKDTFFIQASVKHPFGKATTSDWAGISSAKMRSISNPKTLGKYAVEWMALIRKDDSKWYHRRYSGDIDYEPD
jgi:type II secretory pathway pseudopilin PulG